MTAKAKKHIEEKFFDGYPQHELDYIGDRRLKDIAYLMESYALKIVQEAMEAEKSTNKQLIDALVEVQDSHVMSDGLTLISDQTKAKIKTALRDAGVNEEGS